tara:strand:+ start:1311 stop:2678 length:1368 start_codon:yes stop_codon:yes gene_type:complete
VIDVKIEKQIVTGMIMSTEFLEGIVPIFREQLQAPATNKVATWCATYFKQYGQAPKRHIKDIFKQHSKSLPDEDKFLIEEFLDRLSKKFKVSKSFNATYILDIAEEYLRTIALEELHNRLGTAIDNGAVTKGENIIKKFERAARPETKGIDPFSNEAILKAFDDDAGDKLFRFPGVLGDTVGDFEREYLAAFFGIRGTGKTWWLLWTGLLAVFHGYNVVFVSLEMSEKQIVKRIHQYLNAKPTNKPKGRTEIPEFCDEEDEDGEVTTVFKKQRRKQLTMRTAMSKMVDIDESSLIKANFKLITYPSGYASVSDLKAHLHNMEYYEDFVPDVIITDYADKFKPEIDGEMRHKIGSIWKAHKALAQERKCLVLTASQTNTARTGKDIGVGSAAESMEKENEPDILIALNQNPIQKKQGLMRTCLTKHRHNEYDIIKEIYITQCYSIGRPYLDSKVKS